jgi:hypothetical protein
MDVRRGSKDVEDLSLCTSGLVFFGTPFRGAAESFHPTHGDVLKAAQLLHVQTYPQNYEIFRTDDTYLTGLVDRFCEKLDMHGLLPEILCFYESKVTDVRRLLGPRARVRSSQKSE